jgi:hypothetical protein
MIEIGDQSDAGCLVALDRRYGPFDLIVDDGSHLWDHQIIALRTLLPLMNRRGFYILEDIDVSYGNYADQFRGSSPISAAEYLKKLCDYMVADAAVNIDLEPDPFLRSYGRQCEFICFSRRTSVIHLRGVTTIEKVEDERKSIASGDTQGKPAPLRL